MVAFSEFINNVMNFDKYMYPFNELVLFLALQHLPSVLHVHWLLFEDHQIGNMSSMLILLIL
jgi:hypothetical protein